MNLQIRDGEEGGEVSDADEEGGRRVDGEDGEPVAPPEADHHLAKRARNQSAIIV